MKDYVKGIVLGFVVGAIVISAAAGSAQAPAAPQVVATPTAPTPLDDTERLMVEVLTVRAQLAQCQSESLESTRQFSATRAEVLRRIEAKHPGFTLDSTGKLVAKAPPK